MFSGIYCRNFSGFFKFFAKIWYSVDWRFKLNISSIEKKTHAPLRQCSVTYVTNWLHIHVADANVHTIVQRGVKQPITQPTITEHNVHHLELEL